MKESLRQKINKDDGKHYQIGNHDLNIREIIGYSFFILALLVYIITDKAGFEYGWLGWLFLVIGISFLVIGIKQNDKNT